MNTNRCFRTGCTSEVYIYKNGISTIECKKHFESCIWGKCEKKKTTSWFCKLHFLAKEANYGLNDTDPENKESNKQPGGDFYQWGVKRLRDFATYAIDEGKI